MRTQIRLQKATSRDTPCHWIVIGRLSVLISYETPVAFSLVTKEVPFCCQTPEKISRTTTRHISEAGCAHFPKAESPEEFARQLQFALDEALHPALPTLVALDA